MTTATMSNQEAMKWSRIWATEFGDSNADLLCCFPAQRVGEVLLAMAATEKKENEVCELNDIGKWFLRAVEQKLLVPDFPLSQLAQEQLDELRQKFGRKVPVQAAPAQPTDPNDYNQMTRKQFDAIDSRRARLLYAQNVSFRARADYFWNGGK